MGLINNSVEYLRAGCLLLLPMCTIYVAGKCFFDNIIYAHWIQLLLLLKPWKKPFENVHSNICIRRGRVIWIYILLVTINND